MEAIKEKQDEQIGAIKLEAEIYHADDKVLKFDIGNVVVPKLDFQQYQLGLRANVLIYPLFDNTKKDPFGSDAAILRYLPGAFTPRHVHIGFEMVFVLEGEYVENDVLYKPGNLIIRAPGTTHEMRTINGCTLLAMRDIPVKQLT